MATQTSLNMLGAAAPVTTPAAGGLHLLTRHCAGTQRGPYSATRLGLLLSALAGSMYVRLAVPLLGVIAGFRGYGAAFEAGAVAAPASLVIARLLWSKTRGTAA